MVDFFKKIADWVLEKERDAANDCKINQADVEKQIHLVQTRKNKLKHECEENLSEMEHILNRLHAIKAKSLKCDIK